MAGDEIGCCRYLAVNTVSEAIELGECSVDHDFGAVDVLETLQVVVNQYGILAFDPAPEDYPRIYILDVAEGLRE